MVKVKKLRPLQTQLTMVIPRIHPSQARSSKLYVNLCHNHHRGRVITLERLRSTILLPKLFRKKNLIFIEAANTTYALILIIITQKYTDFDVCKILFQPPLCAIHIIELYVCRTHIFQFFLFFILGQIHINTNHQQYSKQQCMIKQF